MTLADLATIETVTELVELARDHLPQHIYLRLFTLAEELDTQREEAEDRLSEAKAWLDDRPTMRALASLRAIVEG